MPHLSVRRSHRPKLPLLTACQWSRSWRTCENARWPLLRCCWIKGTRAPPLWSSKPNTEHRSSGRSSESTRGPGASWRRLWTVRLWGGLAAAARVLSGIGHLSQRWAPFLDRHGTEKIEVRFLAKTCQECVARTRCTTGARVTHSQAPAPGSIAGAGEPPTGTTYHRIPASICAPCWYRGDDFTRSAPDQNATESLSWGAEDTSASCADCSWDQCASHRHASSCTSSRQAVAP